MCPLKKQQGLQCTNETNNDKNGQDSSSKGDTKPNVAASVETQVEEVHLAWATNSGGAAYSSGTFDAEMY
jgi:hypothetical protein